MAAHAAQMDTLFAGCLQLAGPPNPTLIPGSLPGPAASNAPRRDAA
jgi:hypothetical protein